MLLGVDKVSQVSAEKLQINQQEVGNEQKPSGDVQKPKESFINMKQK
jgi:hypothetical protein